MRVNGTTRIAVLLLASSLVLAGCGGTPTPTATTVAPTATSAPPTATSVPPTATSSPRPTLAPPAATAAPAPTNTQVVAALPATATVPPPTATPAPPTATATAAPTNTPALPATPDPALGAKLWQQKSCRSCHGDDAGGDLGPKLAGLGQSFDQVLLRVRLGKSVMPAFTTQQISDLELQHIYAWLRSLAPATPTAAAKPVFPTGSLLALWGSVDALKAASDFAKDLPARQAGDDAGRLAILKQYATQAVQRGQTALAQANQARAEIPLVVVRSDIDQVISHVNAIVGRANQALAASSYGAAWPHAAEMARISRLDALPLSTQAVRDAGLVGTVRVQVTTQSGSPRAGAFVTVLSAHMPLGARADSQGRVTFSNVAAVPGLQVKAYDANLIYHEATPNIPLGGIADVRIVIPGAGVSGQIPVVANASISPASGSGSASVTFSLRVNDPQGASDVAEDQVFALNPEIGVAYILRAAGNDQYSLQIALPGLAAGVHTWYFFAVDHECNTSNVLTVQYTVR